MRAWLKRLFLGTEKDPLDPRVFEHIALAAFFAWVGLGADGLSSSCYGPEEGYLVLFDHKVPALALVLCLMTATTIAVISGCYAQVIELFPGGGGGYVVGTKLLGPALGLVSGCALLVDYVLTVAISIASGVDAVFSFLPEALGPVKLVVALAAAALLITLNLRGVKESVRILLPVFLLFVFTHVFVILYTLASNLGGLGDAAGQMASQVGDAARESRLGDVFTTLIKAFVIGAGTYTGIEAVSNGMQILKEPRVATGKRTMFYMAASLAFMCAGILIGYVLLRVERQPGQTLNAVLFTKATAGWSPGASHTFLIVTLVSEAMLLFVAAQAGFIGGPRMLATMAVDRWVPQRFARFSDRLVIQDGVLLMGGAAIVFLLVTRAQVKLLVIFYAINVFITFVVSLLGMCVHWWRARAAEPRWKRRFVLCATGLGICITILAARPLIGEGMEGWYGAIGTTGVVAAACVMIRRHYRNVGQLLRRLDLDLVRAPAEGAAPQPPDRQKPVAVLFVAGYNGLGIHSLLTIPRLFGEQFRDIVFVSIGVVDYDRFKGPAEIESLKARVEADLAKYVAYAAGIGFRATSRSAFGTDPVDELVELCPKVTQEYPRSVFFAGHLVFPQETYWTRMLHSQTAYELQRRLQFQGLPMVVLPIRVYGPASAPPPSIASSAP